LKEIIINNLEDTKKLAVNIAALTVKEDVIALQGDLGAGKTTFARFFINSLSDVEQEILSPTFNLVHPYETAKFTIWHFDLYRLESADEVEGLGIYDAFDEGVSLIEWPQIIDDIMPPNRLLVNILENNGTRVAIVEGKGSWKERIAGFYGT
jgi:tRNA threonylcarbamoyl adenosine modification protein YjeE